MGEIGAQKLLDDADKIGAKCLVVIDFPTIDDRNAQAIARHLQHPLSGFFNLAAAKSVEFFDNQDSIAFDLAISDAISKCAKFAGF